MREGWPQTIDGFKTQQQRGWIHMHTIKSQRQRLYAFKMAHVRRHHWIFETCICGSTHIHIYFPTQTPVLTMAESRGSCLMAKLIWGMCIDGAPYFMWLMESQNTPSLIFEWEISTEKFKLIRNSVINYEQFIMVVVWQLRYTCVLQKPDKILGLLILDIHCFIMSINLWHYLCLVHLIHLRVPPW